MCLVSQLTNGGGMSLLVECQYTAEQKWIKFALIEGKKEHKKNIGLSSQSHQTNTEHARQSRGRTTGNLFVMIDISSHD